MTTEKCRQLWLETIHLCESETDREAANLLIAKYSYNRALFALLDDDALLQTFTALVVYEKKFHIKLGSTTPTAVCYQELLNKVKNGTLDREFIYDVGDWAAEYSDNAYVPMGNYRGYGARQYFAFQRELQARKMLERQLKEEKLERKRTEAEAKKIAQQQKKQNRIKEIQALREKNIDESLQIIENSEKPVYYYLELIEEWLLNNALDEKQKSRVMSMLPVKSTKHNAL